MKRSAPRLFFFYTKECYCKFFFIFLIFVSFVPSVHIHIKSVWLLAFYSSTNNVINYLCDSLVDVFDVSYIAVLILEANGSLYSFLKIRGWASSLSAGVSSSGLHRSPISYIFVLSISLTDSGLDKVMFLTFCFTFCLASFLGMARWMLILISATKLSSCLIKISWRCDTFASSSSMCSQYYIAYSDWYLFAVIKYLSFHSSYIDMTTNLMLNINAIYIKSHVGSYLSELKCYSFVSIFYVFSQNNAQK